MAANGCCAWKRSVAAREEMQVKMGDLLARGRAIVLQKYVR